MKNKEKNFISAVVYVHNDGENLESFLKELIHTLENNFEKSEIICVNDASGDSSVAVIKKAAAEAAHTTVSILNMSYFHGVELAMNAGVDLSIGDFVLEFDSAVFDYPVDTIMKVYYKSLEGYDIVSALPDKKERFSSRMFYRIFNRFTALSYEMQTERFRVLSRRVINRISSMNKTVPYRKAVYANCGLKTTGLKYEVTDRSRIREDKTEKRYRKNLAVDTLILFTEVGYSFSMCMTVLMMLVAAFMAVYAIVFYATNNPVQGWTTTILFMAFAFFGLFGILTIVIKYLAILVDLVFKRKHYSFESIEKLTK